MNLSQTANALALATNDEARAALWRSNGANSVLAMAYALKELCLTDGWNGNPARCVGAAEALHWLGVMSPQPEIYALRDWCEGLAAVAHGRYADSLQLLGQAERRWQELGRPHTAAETQVVALYALAMLGRYDEAVECGLQTRDIFLAHNDALAAGKIENNLGNIYFRRDLYHTAEHFQSLARQRFTELRHTVQLAKINNCLANTHAHLHRFASAEKLYAEAWEAATSAQLTLTQAEIAGNRGNLALFQSRYDAALDWLEQSRRHYVALELPHQATLIELEIADIYLELNLLPEARELYQRATQTFAALGMRAEQARALAQHGQAVIIADGLPNEARALLDQAQQLYAAEGNSVGAASVTLNVAYLRYTQKDFSAAQYAATQAAWVLRRSGNRRRWLAARWLCGATARAVGQTDRAGSILHATLRAAETHAQPHIAYRCRVALGLLARDTGRTADAVQHFAEALEIAETLRAILPAEEFRAAFIADKLTPYNELMRAALDADDAALAFHYAERARARTLSEHLAQRTADTLPASDDAFTVQARARLAQLRTELHWFYNLLNRPAAPDAPLRAWQEAVHQRERETLEIARQLRIADCRLRIAESSIADSAVAGCDNPQWKIPQPTMEDSAIIEYAALDANLLAFVVTAEKITVVRDLGTVAELQNLVERLRFQLRAARYGRAAVAAHQTQLIERTRFYLHALHERIIACVAPHAPQERWVIVPHGVLHYVPFHALYDGTDYLLASREIITAPSAALWQHCQNQPAQPLDRALLVGVGDDRAPLVNAEIAALAPLFAKSETLLDAAATLPALRHHAPACGVLHWASHGQFRPDNPLFSTLRLGDGWLTVREAESLPLSGKLVTLSACETGVSHIARGEELTGLAQGFFAAGARSLLLSLWTVDDAAATALMTAFYGRLQNGATPAAALRAAQLELMQDHPHPFYWSPFVLAGA